MSTSAWIHVSLDTKVPFLAEPHRCPLRPFGAKGAGVEREYRIIDCSQITEDMMDYPQELLQTSESWLLGGEEERMECEHS